ncbi:hypothetical protein DFH09DRAFT_1373297 [Mycena vulgaris]|nr:hypothetical protein DFH09DRAFT_1373297 [Mycena vulgaris]
MQHRDPSADSAATSRIRISSRSRGLYGSNSAASWANSIELRRIIVGTGTESLSRHGAHPPPSLPASLGPLPASHFLLPRRPRDSPLLSLAAAFAASVPPLPLPPFLPSHSAPPPLPSISFQICKLIQVEQADYADRAPSVICGYPCERAPTASARTWAMRVLRMLGRSDGSASGRKGQRCIPVQHQRPGAGSRNPQPPSTYDPWTCASILGLHERLAGCARAKPAMTRELARRCDGG